MLLTLSGRTRFFVLLSVFATTAELGNRTLYPHYPTRRHRANTKSLWGANSGVCSPLVRRSTIRFTPPTTSELFFSQLGAGFVRVLLGPLQILFLLALSVGSG